MHERSLHRSDTCRTFPCRRPVPPTLGEAFEGKDPNGLPILPDECMPAPCPVGIQHSRIRDIRF
ncbi:hypothetical protein [Streptomyces cupreus]|uniref:Uncharacterized protein n=1 Tax=Streptomyces cupreus TaxID=2759956 RepID=A0A7X1JBV4_9ACTN|nr:hypothetical protein [Streptomyces cupreus]MBC2907863.1 hypothetical protein [Streptomyces cupreus]